jgi:regulator of replication initiation timing
VNVSAGHGLMQQQKQSMKHTMQNGQSTGDQFVQQSDELEHVARRLGHLENAVGILVTETRSMQEESQTIKEATSSIEVSATMKSEKPYQDKKTYLFSKN